MADNTVTVIGNVTRDPELRFTPSGQAIATFGLAVNRRWQNRQTQEWEENVSFFDVTCWAQLGQNVSRHPVEGQPRHRHRPPRAALVGDRPGRQALQGRDHRRRGRPQPALGHRRHHPQRAQGGRRRPRRWRRRRHPSRPERRRPPATTPLRSPSDGQARPHQEQGQRSPRQEEGEPAAHRARRVRRLEGREPAPPVHVRPGQDPRPSRHRQQHAAAGRDRPGHQERARDGAAALRQPSHPDPRPEARRRARRTSRARPRPPGARHRADEPRRGRLDRRRGRHRRSSAPTSASRRRSGATEDES